MPSYIQYKSTSGRGIDVSSFSDRDIPATRIWGPFLGWC